MKRIGMRHVPLACLLAGGLIVPDASAQSPSPKAPSTVEPRSPQRGPRMYFFATEEEGLAFFRFREELARLGLYDIPGPPARPVAPTWRGSKIVVDADVPKDVMEAHRRFAQRIEQLDHTPPSRRVHFDWIQSTHHGRLKQVWIEGWYGRFQSTGRSADGGWVFKVKFMPLLRCSCDTVNTGDFVTETWSFNPTNNSVVLQDSDAATIRKEHRFFPLAQYPY